MNELSIDIILTGDFCCHNRFASKLENNGEIISEDIKSWLNDSDCVIFNYEGSSAGEIPVDKNKANLKNSPGAPLYVSKFCKPVFNLANNHVLDFGNEGLMKTIALFKSLNLSFFGAGVTSDHACKPFIINKGYQKVHVWGIHPYKKGVAGSSDIGLNGLRSLKFIKKAISEQAGNQKNIVCIHGGEEFSFYPMPYKRRLLCRIANDLKPDFIICHHSHTIQGIEKIGETVIFYSLGNFMFDYPSHRIFDDSDLGMCVKIIISNGSIAYETKIIKCDTENYVIDFAEQGVENAIKKRLSVDKYDEEIGKDAYRVVFGSKKNRNRISTGITSFKKNKVYFHKIRLLLSILSDRFLMSLYWQAFRYKVLKKL